MWTFEVHYVIQNNMRSQLRVIVSNIMRVSKIVPNYVIGVAIWPINTLMGSARGHKLCSGCSFSRATPGNSAGTT